MIKNRSTLFQTVSPTLFLTVLLALGLLALAIFLGLNRVQVSPKAEPVSAVSAAQLAQTRAWAADAARWRGLANEFIRTGRNINVPAQPIDLNRGQKADALRYSEQAKLYVLLHGSSVPIKIAVNSPVLTRGQAADAARWTAMALAYGKTPDSIAIQVADMIGRENPTRP